MNDEIILTVDESSPYLVGARAYVTQTDSGAVITIIDKDGTTTATVTNGADGRDIESITLNADYTLTILYSDGESTTTTSIRGATGASGVYVGDDEPEDPDVNVWVDTDGEPDIPTLPTMDGTYALQVVVSGGVPTYLWVSID